MLVKSNYYSVTRLGIGTDNPFMMIGICDVTMMKVLPGMKKVQKLRGHLHET